MSYRFDGKLAVTAILIGAMVITIIVATLMVVKVESEEITVTEGEVSRIVTKTSLIFDEKSWARVDKSSLLVGILTASGAILAITFVITQIVISSISERYSWHILDLYTKGQKTNLAFLSLILVAATSATLLLISDLLNPVFSFAFVTSAVVGFIISLLIFIRHFYGMFRLISPLTFVDDIKNSAMKLVQDQNEKQASDLIQALGDTATKSIDRNDIEICQRCIDRLHDIVAEFLDLRQKDEEKYKVIHTSLLMPLEPKNQYLNYVCEQYVRLFSRAIKDGHAGITRSIIMKSYAILHKMMLIENNESAIQTMIETSGLRGAMYWQLMAMALDSKSEREKMLLALHLVDFPRWQMIEGKYLKYYIDQFISVHLFRINKLIIDRRDFETFKAEIDYMSKSLFSDPSDIAEDIANRLYLSGTLAIDDELNKKREELQFMIRYVCARNLETMGDFVQKLEECRRLVLQRISGQGETQSIDNHFNDIAKKAQELYITSRLYGTFFRMGAYLIFKGQGYEKFIKELWYHTQPVETRAITTNITPVSNDVNWQTLFIMYGGGGSTIWHDSFEFDDFQDAGPFLFKYYALLLLKLCKNFKLPQKDQLARWRDEDALYKLDFWYEVAKSIPMDDFIKALDDIAQSDDLLKTVRTENVEEKAKSIREGLETLKEQVKELEIEIVKLKPVVTEKVEESIRMIRESYGKNSHSERIAVLHHDNSKPLSDFKTLKHDQETPRECFIDSAYVDCGMLWGSGSPLANLETLNILSVILQANVKTLETQGSLYLQEIRDGIKLLTDKGYDPDVIFIPLKIRTKLFEENPQMIKSPFGNLEINGKQLHTIHSWKGLQFNDIIVFDSKGLALTYKADDSSNRVSIEFIGLEEANYAVHVISKLHADIKVTDSNAFIRISIKGLDAEVEDE